MELAIIIVSVIIFFMAAFIRSEVKREKEDLVRREARLLEKLKTEPKARLLIKTKNYIYTESFEAKIESLGNIKWVINAGFLAAKRKEQIVFQSGHFVLTNDKLVHVGDIVDLEVVIDKP